MNALYSRGDAVRSRAKAEGSPLDSSAYEAVERFARVLVRCGFDTHAIAEAFGLALAASRSESPSRPREGRELPEAPHLVTLWCSSPDYVDDLGNPLPLPARGSGRSVESLVHRIDREMDATEVLRYLLRTRTVRKVGRKYVLGRRWIMLRGVAGSAHSRSIRGLVGMLRTLEHNLLADSDAHSWFEFTAENPRFPVSQLEAFDRLLRRTGLGSLRKLDLFMQHCEATRKLGEPTVWLGVGMHRFQQNVAAAFASRTAERARRGSATRRKTRRS
jgi:hypothetical protein